MRHHEKPYIFIFLLVHMTQNMTFAASISPYEISSPEFGTCRMKGINVKSDNYRYYASIGVQGGGLHDACGRCIRISCSDSSGKTCKSSASVTAYVLDVCQNCGANSIKASPSVLSLLSVSAQSASDSVSYEFVACSKEFLSGNIKACFMEGASNTYIPLQFYNSKQIITDASISKMKAVKSKDSFLFSATPNNPQNSGSDAWLKNIEVLLTGADGESLSTTFAFDSKTGCATSDVQFARDSAKLVASENTSEDSGRGSASLGLILGSVFGSIAALGLIIAAFICFKRRRNDQNSKADATSGESAAQTLSARALPMPNNVTNIEESAQQSPNHGQYSNAETPAMMSRRLVDTFSDVNTLQEATNSPQNAEHSLDIIPNENLHAGDYARGYSDDEKPSFMYDSYASRQPDPRNIRLSNHERDVPFAHSKIDTDGEDEDRASFDIDFARQMDDSIDSSQLGAREPDLLEIVSPHAHNTMQSNAQALNSNKSIEISRSPERFPSTQFSYTLDAEREHSAFEEEFLQDQASRQISPRPIVKSDACTSIVTEFDPDACPQSDDSATALSSSNGVAPLSSSCIDLREPNTHPTHLEVSSPVYSRSHLGSGSGGYSRSSLNLLGYPFAKRNSSTRLHANIPSPDLQDIDGRIVGRRVP